MYINFYGIINLPTNDKWKEVGVVSLDVSQNRLEKV